MKIYGNLMTIADGNQPAPAGKIESDFFTSNMELSLSSPVKKDAPETEANPFRDWRYAVNRAFMQGHTAADIFRAFGDQIAASPAAEEITAYIKKYEGLVGTVFIDCTVVENGLPLSAIPRRYRPYNLYAINCRHPRVEKTRSVEGGYAGEIDQFLQSANQTAVKETEYCDSTGLPVLKRGMFDRAAIHGVLALLGEEGDTLAQLQKALRQKVLGVGVPAAPKQEFQKPDLSYGLKEGEIALPEEQRPVESRPVDGYGLKRAAATLVIAPEQKEVVIEGYAPSQKQDIAFEETPEAKTAEDFGLQEGGLDVAMEQPAPEAPQVQLGYSPSQNQDIAFEEPPAPMKDPKLDGVLRF